MKVTKPFMAAYNHAAIEELTNIVATATLLFEHPSVLSTSTTPFHSKNTCGNHGNMQSVHVWVKEGCGSTPIRTFE